jgi:hypothetical protein
MEENNIPLYLRKARTVEPQKQPLLAKVSGTTFVFRQWLRNKQRNNVRFYAISKNRRPLLGNISVNKLPRQQIRMQQRNGVFYMVQAEML